MTDTHDQRMARFERAGLYLVTSQALSAGRTTLDIVKAALSAGVTLIQLREKQKSDAKAKLLDKSEKPKAKKVKK